MRVAVAEGGAEAVLEVHEAAETARAVRVGSVRTAVTVTGGAGISPRSKDSQIIDVTDATPRPRIVALQHLHHKIILVRVRPSSTLQILKPVMEIIIVKKRISRAVETVRSGQTNQRQMSLEMSCACSDCTNESRWRVRPVRSRR
jgi:hypothetical protein